MGWFVDELARLKLPPRVHLLLTFVEDGSSDSTVPRLQALAATHPWVRYFSLKKGFGQIPALMYGLRRSTADAQILMDGDGSHPVGVIPQMIRHFLDGASIVQAYRKDRSREHGIRKWGAYLFRLCVLAISRVDLRRQTVYFRLIDAKTRAQVLADPRCVYFFRLRLPRDESVRYVEFDFIDRSLGESKYPVIRLAKFAGTGILSLLSPLWFCAYMAVVLGGIGAAATVSPWILLLLPVCLWLSFFYWKMSTNRILDSMTTKAQSDALGGANVAVTSR